MEEQVRQTTTEERTTWNRDRAFTLARALWRDFGPLLVGALVLIVVVVGGWTLFNRISNNPNPQETVVDQQAASDVTLPESTINISPASPTATAAATPTPTPTGITKGGNAQATPSATPTTLAMGETKGGLPKTGPEAIYAGLSLMSMAGGYFLVKRSQKIFK